VPGLRLTGCATSYSPPKLSRGSKHISPRPSCLSSAPQGREHEGCDRCDSRASAGTGETGSTRIDESGANQVSGRPAAGGGARHRRRSSSSSSRFSLHQGPYSNPPRPSSSSYTSTPSLVARYPTRTSSGPIRARANFFPKGPTSTEQHPTRRARQQNRRPPPLPPSRSAARPASSSASPLRLSMQRSACSRPRPPSLCPSPTHPLSPGECSTITRRAQRSSRRRLPPAWPPTSSSSSSSSRTPADGAVIPASSRPLHRLILGPAWARMGATPRRRRFVAGRRPLSIALNLLRRADLAGLGHPFLPPPSKQQHHPHNSHHPHHPHSQHPSHHPHHSNHPSFSSSHNASHPSPSPLHQQVGGLLVGNLAASVAAAAAAANQQAASVLQNGGGGSGGGGGGNGMAHQSPQPQRAGNEDTVWWQQQLVKLSVRPYLTGPLGRKARARAAG